MHTVEKRTTTKVEREGYETKIFIRLPFARTEGRRTTGEVERKGYKKSSLSVLLPRLEDWKGGVQVVNNYI